MAIIKCSCRNTYMDKVYGKGKRVFNPIKSVGSQEKYRCASCGIVEKSKS